jgi:hypothetical protein
MVLLRRSRGRRECAGAREFIEAQRISRQEATSPWLSWPVVSTRTQRLAILVGVAVVAAFAVAVGIRAFGGPGTATKAEYRATIVNVRNRVDYAYGRIATPANTDQPLQERVAERLDEASATIAATANDLDNASVAPGFQDLNTQLVDKLREFSNALANTAAQFRDPAFEGALSGLNSLGFTQWDDVNGILAKMNEQGLKVEALKRH